MVTALSTYATNAPSASLPNAGTLATAAGGAEVSIITAPPFTGIGYFEMLALGGSSKLYTALPSPTGFGWLLDSTLLEGQSLVAGTWTVVAALANPGIGIIGWQSFSATYFSSALWDFYVRFFRFNLPNGNYTLIGNGSLTSQLLPAARTLFTFPSISGILSTFTTGDKLYMDLFASPHVLSTSPLICQQRLSNDAVTLYESNSATGVANDLQVTTPGYQAGTLSR